MAGALWDNVRDVLGEVTDLINEFNADGFDLYFLNNDHTRLNVRVSDKMCSTASISQSCQDRDAVETVFNLVMPSGGPAFH